MADLAERIMALDGSLRDRIAAVAELSPEQPLAVLVPAPAYAVAFDEDPAPSGQPFRALRIPAAEFLRDWVRRMGDLLFLDGRPVFAAAPVVLHSVFAAAAARPRAFDVATALPGGLALVATLASALMAEPWVLFVGPGPAPTAVRVWTTAAVSEFPVFVNRLAELPLPGLSDATVAVVRTWAEVSHPHTGASIRHPLCAPRPDAEAVCAAEWDARLPRRAAVVGEMTLGVLDRRHEPNEEVCRIVNAEHFNGEGVLNVHSGKHGRTRCTGIRVKRAAAARVLQGRIGLIQGSGPSAVVLFDASRTKRRRVLHDIAQESMQAEGPLA